MQIVLNIGRDQKIMIRGGDNSFEICQERQKKDQTVWAATGYYADLAAALNAVAKLKIRDSDARTLQELKAVILAVRQELTEVWRTAAV